MRTAHLCIVGSVCLAAVGLAQADLTLYPTIPVEGDTPLSVTGDHPAGWDGGSWSSTGSGYTKLWLNANGLFGHDVYIRDLSSISYWTKKATTHAVSAADWYFQFYTVKTSGPYWYGSRINAEPYFSQNLTETAGEWTQWTTGENENNRLRFFDSSNNNYFGSYTDGFLSDLTSSSTYKDQQISWFMLGLGTGWANGFLGQVDGLTITLTNGESVRVNLEAIPAPGAALLVIIGMPIVGWIKRRMA